MLVVRIYSGSDGRSHFEELELPLAASEHGAFSDVLPLGGARFRIAPAGPVLDLHPSPRRELVVNILGEVELACGDGTRRRIGPGGVVLAEDTTGEGHTSQITVGPRHSLTLSVPEDFDVSPWRADAP